MAYRVVAGNGQRTWLAKVDPVYRILDRKEYIQEFFETGLLKISTLAAMKKYPDEMKGDPGEGSGSIGTDTQDGKTHFFLYDTAVNAYAMCTTAHLSKEVIHDFNGVGAIRIIDPTQFGVAVAGYLPGIVEGVEGHCEYVESRSDWADGLQEIVPLLKQGDEAGFAKRFHQHTPGTEAFRKPMKYAHQKEYRILWFSKSPVQEPVLIHCPLAVHFCEPVWF
jgi:hypothetical protein